MGHVIYFYLEHTISLLPIEKIIYDDFYSLDLSNFYDSKKTPLKYRNNSKYLLDYKTCITIYQKVIIILKDFINTNTINNIETYIIMLGVLHNEMHNEAFIFNSQSIFKKTINVINHKKNNSNIINEFTFIDYNEGEFSQGINDSEDNLIFDYEKPAFKKKINKFSVSKYPVTEHMFSLFIRDCGYENDDYWCYNGLLWKNNNDIKLPLYWIYDYKEEIYYKMVNNEKISINSNIPISNISYYEAKAYCKWKNVRLPSESEYEYISTNCGSTKYPWGNKKINDSFANINYNNNILDVNAYKEGNNYKGVSQLIGNIWEWCEESIYPYDGFTMDPIYRDMSYPFFGFKKICKGGCFAVADFLIHPKYRNAQHPDCRIQYIGFRVCKI